MGARMASTARALTFTTAAVVLGALLGGCALLFVSTDGLSGGADAVVDAAGSDAFVSDAFESDALVSDAGTDSSSTTDGATGGFCASNPGHLFCDDFDDREDPSVGWQTDQGGRCVGDVDLVHFKSAPHSVRADTPTGPEIVSYAHITRSFGETTKLRVSFDIYVTPPSGSVGDSLGTVNFPQGYFDMGWYTSGDFRLTERTNSPNVDHISTVTLPSGKWVRVLIQVTPGHVLASFDGVVGIDAATASFSGNAGISLGLFSEDTFSIAANYDNILVDTSF